MKILSVTAQKPHSTGSGVYLTELVNAFQIMGHEQAVVAGVYEDDEIIFPQGVESFPVYYQLQELPFAIAGMSDDMPYESTIYSEMTEEMVQQFSAAFIKKMREVVASVCPDIILCHHLYLLTSLIREEFMDRKIYGICHGTDLRQMKKHHLKQDYIRTQISNLDGVFALHKIQKSEIVRIYGIQPSKIEVIGSGYNDALFKNENIRENEEQKTLIYAGKLARAKGVMSLINSLQHLPYEASSLQIKLAGGSGNQEELDGIFNLIKGCKYKVQLLGKLTHRQLAHEFNKSHIFVLPSFYEGLPLVLMEALACGLKVVATDLPGVRDWMEENIPNNHISYVQIPHMKNADEPKIEELPLFEKELAMTIQRSFKSESPNGIDLNNVSWKGVCNRILLGIEQIYI